MKPKIFVRGDIDGFFGLMIDNLIQLLVLTGLCVGLCGFPMDFMAKVVLPGVAVSLLVGNLFYSWQAYQKGVKENRDDITALPYGINTVSLFAFVFFILFPVYRETGDYMQAWKVGLLASLLSGVIEFLGSFVAHGIRKATPRAALLSSLAGIAITFISMDFLLKNISKPSCFFYSVWNYTFAIFCPCKISIYDPRRITFCYCRYSTCLDEWLLGSRIDGY
jgi:AGZA family xanthine/uracil permease-like MFS transporter